MADGVLRALKRDIADGRVLVVVGAGVSVESSGSHQFSSWKELLKHGVDITHGFSRKDDAWRDRQLNAIDNGDTVDWLGGAQQIETRLTLKNEFSRFLSETVGAIPLKNRDLLEAIRKIEAQL
jgi:hypothetical protein